MKINDTKIYACLMVMSCFFAGTNSASAISTFGVFFKPLANEFGWSRASVSSAYTFLMIGYAISVMISGSLVDRYNPYYILLGSAPIAGFAFLLCSQIHDINEFRFFIFLVGIGSGAAFSVPNAVVQKCFFKSAKSGLAIGIVISGFSVGSLFYILLVSNLIPIFGWRYAFFFTGSICFLVMSFSSCGIKMSLPRLSYFTSQRIAEQGNRNIQSKKTYKFLGTYPFWGITFVHCTVIASFGIIAVHFVPFITDVGISHTTAAAALGFLGAFSILGRIIPGFLSEKLHWKKILSFSLFAMMLLYLSLIFLNRILMVYLFVFFYGIFHGSRISAHLGIIGEFFGTVSIGEVIGATYAIGMFIGSITPFIAGLIFDTTGSYILIFIFIMFFLLISALIASTLKKPLLTER